MRTTRSTTVPSSTFVGKVGLAWIVLGLPVLAHFVLIGLNASDIPRGDDLISIVPFLNRWASAASIGQHLDLLFAQYTSHRIVLTKCAAALSLYFGGYCNFTWLQAFGWVSWLAVTILILRASPRVRTSPILGLPVMLILMQPQGATNFHIAMQAVGNLGVLFLSFGALALVYSPGRRGFLIGCALAVLAPLSSVNGLLVFPAAAIGLGLSRRWGRCIGFLIVGALAWALYFIGYSNPQVPFRAVEFLHNAAIMVGATVRFGSVGFGFATAAGGAILFLATVALIYAGWRRQPSILALFLLFIGLSVAMAARGRIGWGPAYMDQDRYRPYGLLAIALLYLLSVERLPHHRERIAAATAICIAGLFCLASYANYLPSVTGQRNWTAATAMNAQLGQEFFNITPDQWQASRVEWKLASARRLVRPPTLLSEPDLALIGSLGREEPPRALPFNATGSASLAAYSLTPGLGEDLERPSFSVILHQGRPLVLPVNVWRAPFGEIPRRGSFYSDRFELILPMPLMEPGPHWLYGLTRGSSRTLIVVWRAQVALPELTLDPRPASPASDPHG